MSGILDIFNNQSFDMVELTQAINIVPNMYGRLQELNLFPAQPVPTTSVSIEFENGVLNLLPTRPRGGPATQGTQPKRHLRVFGVPHIPHEDVVKAEEVQNVRVLGSSNQLETVMGVVNRKLMTIRRKHAITLEHLRIGALKGKVIDADGSTIVDLFQEFGVEEKVVNFQLDNPDTDVDAKCHDVLGFIEDNLLGETMTAVRGFCSPEFWDAFKGHKKVRDAYLYFQSNQPLLREDLRKGFYHQGIWWEEYRGMASVLNPDGTTTTRRFIPAGDVRFVPEGMTESMGTYFAPADFMEAVNTLGKEVYAKQAPEKFNRWVDLHTQSNPLPICRRPRLLVRGTRQ